MLWGSYAQKKAAFVDSVDQGGRHLVLKAPHPSPAVGAYRLLRLPPFLEGQCLPGEPRPAADRLGAAGEPEWRRSISTGSSPRRTDIYAEALAELRARAQASHWMWFVFPQIAGLGRSPTARFYAIASAGEARAYLAHPLLGPRLRRMRRGLLAHRGQNARRRSSAPSTR